FEIFTWEVNAPQKHGHITFLPVSTTGFAESMINCHAIISGAGFETPAEALYLGKKMMIMPIKGQYEQRCNAAALEQLGIRSIYQLDGNFKKTFADWINDSKAITLNYEFSTGEIISHLMHTANHYQEKVGVEFLESAFR
ncbi:MAG TPA: glycosyltransferase family protein, partial [Chitinophagaceae bacterium]|nr:glycosyltransferase family protein [Chitinophagaceae bacterium]